jgi:hypothetical protein
VIEYVDHHGRSAPDSLTLLALQNNGRPFLKSERTASLSLPSCGAGVAGLVPLNLDDVGPEIGEQLPSPRPRKDSGYVENTDTI